MSERDVTAMLTREADVLPPPPDTDVETVLRAGRRRRRVRHAGYAAAAAAVLVTAVGVTTAGVRSGPGPVSPPQIAQPFGPAYAKISVCDPEADCQPVAPELLDQVTDIIGTSRISEVVEIRDGEDLAAAFEANVGGSPPEGFAQATASQVVFKISETTDPMPLLRELVELPVTGTVSLGTATTPPIGGPGLAPGDSPKHERLMYRTLDAPVAGRDNRVSYTTYRDTHGQLCIDEGTSSTSCSWTTIGPGLLSGGVGPHTEADTGQHCVRWLTGYDVDRIEIELEDGTTVPNVSTTARNDLSYPRLAAGCWIGPQQTVTTVAYDANGNEVDRHETDPNASPPPPSPTSTGP